MLGTRRNHPSSEGCRTIQRGQNTQYDTGDPRSPVKYNNISVRVGRGGLESRGEWNRKNPRKNKNKTTLSSRPTVATTALFDGTRSEIIGF